MRPTYVKSRVFTILKNKKKDFSISLNRFQRITKYSQYAYTYIYMYKQTLCFITAIHAVLYTG